MGEALAECLEAALAATVAKLDTSRLKKVEIVVSQPRGVPAGSVTIVAHARAPLAHVAMARKRDASLPQQDRAPQRPQRGSASQQQLQQPRQRREQQQPPRQERSSQASRVELKRLKLQSKWRVRRLVAFARIYLDGTFRRWLRLPREQREAHLLRTIGEQRFAQWQARHKTAPSAVVDTRMPSPSPGQSVLGPRCASEMDSQSAPGTSEGKRRARPPSKAAALEARRGPALRGMRSMSDSEYEERSAAFVAGGMPSSDLQEALSILDAIEDQGERGEMLRVLLEDVPKDGAAPSTSGA